LLPSTKKGRVPTEQQLNDPNYEWENPAERSFIVENTKKLYKRRPEKTLEN
jgi:hypothetical protein